MIRQCLTLLLLLHSLFGFSQTKTFSIQFENLPIESILDIVTAKTGYNFSFNSDIIQPGNRFTMNESNIGIDHFLNKLLVGTGLQHQIFEDQIILKLKTIETSPKSATTFSINGRVTDLQTDEPLPSVNVFLSGTNLGGITDLNGYYTIEKIPVGYHEVIFSHLSYEMVTEGIQLFSSGVITVNAQLPFRSILLDTIEVVSKRLIGPSEREKYLRIFENEFLGRSQNAMKCTLINPEVLDFIYDPKQDKLEVFSLTPLEIENRYIGYHITYYFESFVKTGNATHFYGKARFENLKPQNGQEEKRWIKNRMRIYQGSFLHFRRSLVNDQLRKDQFRISMIPTDTFDQIPHVSLTKVKREDILTQIDEQSFRLDFKGFLNVTYRRKPDEAYFDPFSEAGLLNQQSILKLNDEPIVIKLNGRMQYPGLETFGYWYWERIGDLLPENYDPLNDSF